MPIALLLQESADRMEKALKRIEGWNQLVLMEALLVGRARGAFLTNWFGVHLPLHGRYPQIWIENIDVLRRHRDSLKRTDEVGGGPNLLEPLAGLTGLLAGQAVSPVYSTLLAAYVMKNHPRWQTILLGGLNIATGGLLATALTPILGAGAVVAFPLAAMLDIGAPIYRLLGALATVAAPFERFWSILSGPRDPSHIRNPILFEMLRLADRLAYLLPQLMGLFAALVRDLRFRLLLLAPQIPHLALFVLDSVDTLSFIFDDLSSKLDSLTGGKRSPLSLLKGALGAVSGLVKLLTKQLPPIVNAPLDFIKEGFKRIGEGFGEFAAAAEQEVDALKNAPLWEQLKQAKERFEWAGNVFSKSPKKKSTGFVDVHLFDPMVDRFIDQLPSFTLKEPFPDLPTLADSAVITKALGGEPPPFAKIGSEVFWRSLWRRLPFGLGAAIDPKVAENPFALDEEGTKGLEAARHPASIFGAEWGRLRKELGERPSEALRRYRVHELSLRQHLEDIVNNMLPAGAAPYFGVLEQTFRSLDKNLDLPDLAVPETGALNVRTGSLRVVVEGGQDRSATQVWMEKLKAALVAERYVVASLP